MSARAVPEERLLELLRGGDEHAFRTLVSLHDRPMRRLALSFVHSPSVADEVVQDTWMAVIRGLGGFEGRSSLKTWIFRILVNRARSRGAQESRTAPMSSLAASASASDDESGPTVDADRFLGDGSAFAGYWTSAPSRFFELPEDRLLAGETVRLVAGAIARLPERQQQVIALRDIEGWEAGEVCASLGLSEGNQRVLLHRARAAVRAAMEEHFAEEVSAA